MESIRNTILLRRRQLGITQTELARRAGLGKSTLCDIEKGRLIPSVKSLQKIAHALGIPIASFFESDDLSCQSHH